MSDEIKQARLKKKLVDFIWSRIMRLIHYHNKIDK